MHNSAGDANQRNSAWHAIWDRKAEVDCGASLHVTNGYDLLSDDQWHALVTHVVAPIVMRADDHVIEFGCGAGAFLRSVQRIVPGVTVTGLDYSASLVAVARERVQGVFEVHDITQATAFEDQSFNVALSFGVVNYLDTVEDVARCVREMCRLARRAVYIGEVNDLDRKSIGESIRASTHQQSHRVSPLRLDQLWMPAAFFSELAEDVDMECRIVDHRKLGLDEYAATQYRYSVYLTRPRGLGP